MEQLIAYLTALFENRGADPLVATYASQAIGVVILIALAVAVNFIAKRVILAIVHRIVHRTPWKWDDALADAGVFTRLSHLAPAFVFSILAPEVFGEGHASLVVINAIVNVYLIIISLSVVSAALNALSSMLAAQPVTSNIPVKGFAQAIKLIIIIIGVILILSVLFGRSPVYFLSGIGAATAVLLLVFRDAILGLVAGVMISANQMVRIGDWIEMPKASADGDVIDVSLTTVKVRNWDRTITTIPSYDLISSSFKNWRGMTESGGRRIKRSILIDMDTVSFATPEMLERWRRISILDDYLQSKLKEVEIANDTPGLDMSVLCNGRRLTNLGTFRAYCIAYIQANDKLRHDMISLVRQLEPSEHGIPIEIYVFTADIRWVYHEAIQADIFDHLLSVVSEFGLRVFQEPSSNAIHKAVQQIKTAAKA